MLESNRNIKEFHTDNKIQQWKALSLNKPKHKNQIKSLILHHALKWVKYVMYTNPHIYKSRLIYYYKYSYLHIHIIFVFNFIDTWAYF